jgi:hypothetical protein
VDDGCAARARRPSPPHGFLSLSHLFVLRPAMHTADVVLFAFTLFNAMQIVSYIPQILCVARDRHGASAISYSTWAIWLAGSGATTAYAMVNFWDPWLAAVNAVHTLCCGIVIGLTALKRSRHIRRATT